jgi:hypothetical protein
MAQSAQMVGTAFRQVFSTADQWAEIGISAERSKLALQSLVGVGRDYTDMIDAVQAGTRGAVTEGEAAAQAYQLMRFGLADSATEMQKFMDTVSKVAAANPRLGGTSEAITQISLTLSNMSFMRLDQLGISAGEVRQRMAALKQETAGLSTEEAFQTAVMEELTEQANALGDGILKVNDAQQRFEARWRGFKEGLGLEIAEGFEGAATAAEDFNAVLNKIGPTAGLAYVLGELTGINNLVGLKPEDYTGVNYGGFSEGQVMGMGMSEGQFISGYDQGGQPTLAGNAPYQGSSGGFMQAAMGQARYAQEWFDTHPLGRQAFMEYNLSADQRSLLDSAQTGAAIRGQYGRSGSPMAGADIQGQYGRTGNPMQFPMGTWGGALGTASSIAGGMGNLPGAVRQTAFSTIAGVAEHNVPLQAGDSLAQSLYNQAIPATQTLTSVLGDAAKAVMQLGQNGEALGNQWGSLDEKFGVVRDSFDVEVYDRMSEALNAAEVDTGTLNEALSEYEHKTGMANAQTAIFDGLMTDLAEQLKQGNLSATEYTDAVMALGQTDLSIFDAMLAPLRDSDFDTYMTMLERLQQMDFSQLGALQALPSTAVSMAGSLVDMLPFGGGEGEDDPIAVMQEQMDAMTAMSIAPGTALGDSFTSGVAISQEQLTSLDEQLTSMAGRTYTIPVNLAIASSGDVNITVPVNIDGREVATATTNANKRENKARTAD